MMYDCICCRLNSEAGNSETSTSPSSSILAMDGGGTVLAGESPTHQRSRMRRTLEKPSFCSALKELWTLPEKGSLLPLLEVGGSAQ